MPTISIGSRIKVFLICGALAFAAFAVESCRQAPLAPVSDAGGVELYRLTFPRDGKDVTFVKRYEPQSGRFTAGLLQADGSLAPEVLPKPPAHKVSDRLAARIETSKQDEPLRVIISLVVPPRAPYQLPESPAHFDREAFTSKERGALDAFRQAKASALAPLQLAPAEIITNLSATTLIFARLTPARVKQIAGQPNVAGIDLQDVLTRSAAGPRTPDSGVTKALNETGMAALHARGIMGGKTANLAIWEAGRCIDSVVTVWQADPGGTRCDPHANDVAKVAASFDLLSDVGDATYDTIEEEEALSRIIGGLLPRSVINKSEVWYQDDPKDWPKNRYPGKYDQYINAALGGRWSAQMVVGAGNNNGGEWVLHHSYNTINVTGTSNYSWKNPESPHGDRELPELAAPESPPGGGTSFAAPAVAGTLSVLQEYHGAMIVPMFARAVLFASAWRQLDPGPSWFEDVQAHRDRRWGVGELDAGDAVAILDELERQHPPGVGGPKGGWWGVATRPASGPFVRDYLFQVNDPGTTRLRIALAWNDETTSDDPVLGRSGWQFNDLDVMVLDSGLRIVGKSATLDNNYELIEATVPGSGTYRLRIIGNDLAADAAVVYGVAWTSRKASPQ